MQRRQFGDVFNSLCIQKGAREVPTMPGWKKNLPSTVGKKGLLEIKSLQNFVIAVIIPGETRGRGQSTRRIQAHKTIHNSGPPTIIQLKIQKLGLLQKDDQKKRNWQRFYLI